MENVVERTKILGGRGKKSRMYDNRPTDVCKKTKF